MKENGFVGSENIKRGNELMASFVARIIKFLEGEKNTLCLARLRKKEKKKS